MKISISKTVREDVEVELPYYTKSVAHFYKVFNSELGVNRGCIQIYDAGFGAIGGIQEVDISLALSESNNQCSEQDFNDAHNRIIKKLETFNK